MRTPSLLVITILFSVLFLMIAWPLLIPVAMAGVFAVLFFPWQLWLEKHKIPAVLASALLTLGISLLFLAPATLLIFFGVRALLDQIHLIKSTSDGSGTAFMEHLLNSSLVQGMLNWISTWFPGQVHEFLRTAQDLAKAIGLKLADALGSFFTNLPARTMGLALMVISFYFFLADGKKLALFVTKNTALNPAQTKALVTAFKGLCRSVILASLAAGLVQSIFFFIVCLGVGIENAPLIAFLVFLASFIPLIGATPVSFGVALNYWLLGNQTTGIILFVAACILGVIDNLVRPLVLKGAGNLHPLLAFIAAFGGIQVLGITGIFLGPIIAGLFAVSIQNLIAARSASSHE